MSVRVLARVLLALVCAWSSQLGAAQAYDWDFLDRLSGPGPFRGHGYFYRFGCLSRIDDGDDTRTALTFLSPIPRVRQELPLIAPGASAETWAAYDCARDALYQQPGLTAPERRYLGYMSVTYTSLGSSENVLYPDAPAADENQVRIHRLELAYTHRVNSVLAVTGGLGVGIFTGDAFDTFARVWVSPSVEVTPLAVFGSNRKLRALKVRTLAGAFAPGFDTNDFCRESGSCADARPDFRSGFEALKRFSVFVDVPLLLSR
ncbi:MAG: hypothetical protein AB7G23_08595 [Vicinamibacterales bacterium]